MPGCPTNMWGGRVVRRCCVNFQCWGILLIWIIVGQGPGAFAVGASGDGLDIFSLVYHFSFLSPCLWEMAQYRLKYCLKGPLSPKQPTNKPTYSLIVCPEYESKQNVNFEFLRIFSLQPTETST